MISQWRFEEEAQACIDHFSPYIEWRDVAVKHEFQALTLAEAWEEIWAYETWSHKSLWGWGWPKAMKLPSPGFVKVLMGLDYSPREFWQRSRKNWWSNSYGDHGDQTPRWVTLDKNNSASGWQLPSRQVCNSRWRQDTDQSGYYSEDSKFDSVSVTSATSSEASITREGQNREQEGTFDCHLNQKTASWLPWTRWSRRITTSIAISYCKSSTQWHRNTMSLQGSMLWDSIWQPVKFGSNLEKP